MTEQRSHWSEWVTTVLGMIWLGLFPFWQDGSFSRITHSKWVGMLVLTGVTAAVCGRMLAALWRRGELGARVRVGWLHGAALVYFVLVGMSAVYGAWADYLNESGQLTVLWGARRYEGLYTQLCYAAIFLCMSLTAVNIPRLLDIAADALLVFTGVVALQYLDINVLELFPAGRSIHTNYEFQGTIGNIDMVSGYVSLVMPALLGGFLLRARGGWWWLVSGLAGVLLMLCMEVQSGLIVVLLTLFVLFLLAMRSPAARWRFLLALGGSLMLVTARLLLGLPWLDGTESLTILFAWWKLVPLALGSALTAAALWVSRHPGREIRLRDVLIVTAALIVMVLLAVYFAPIPAGNGLWELQELLHGRPQDTFGSERIGVWRLTLEMSAHSPIFGNGPDTFLYAMDDYMAQTGQELVQRFDNPHNMLLAILSNNGIPAMLAFIVLCAGALAQGLWRMRRNPMLAVLLLAVGCYLAQGMFTFSICLVTPMFWAMLGMLAAYCHRTTDMDGKDAETV